VEFADRTQHINNTSYAPFAQANWHPTPSLTITTGVRLSVEDRTNNGSTFIRDSGFAPELNPAIVNGINLGGFSSSSTGAMVPGNSADQLALADRTASKYFGVAAYNALSTAQKQQIADAKAIRARRSASSSRPATPSPSRPTSPRSSSARSTRSTSR